MIPSRQNAHRSRGISTKAAYVDCDGELRRRDDEERRGQLWEGGVESIGHPPPTVLLSLSNVQRYYLVRVGRQGPAALRENDLHGCAPISMPVAPISRSSDVESPDCARLFR